MHRLRKWRMNRTPPNLAVSSASPTWWKSRYDVLFYFFFSRANNTQNALKI